MRKIFIIMTVILTSISLFAQDDDEFRTIFDGGINKIRGFGGPTMTFSVIDGEFAHLMGGGGGLILNDQLIIGGFGMGLTNYIDAKENLDANGVDDYDGLEVNYSFGGLWFGYIIKGRYPIHPVIHTQIGWGSASLVKGISYTPYEQDRVFVVNPILELEMNITRFFRLAVGANYRLNLGINRLEKYGNDHFSGPGGFLSFKFGWF